MIGHFDAAPRKRLLPRTYIERLPHRFFDREEFGVRRPRAQAGRATRAFTLREPPACERLSAQCQQALEPGDVDDVDADADYDPPRTGQSDLFTRDLPRATASPMGRRLSSTSRTDSTESAAETL